MRSFFLYSNKTLFFLRVLSVAVSPAWDDSQKLFVTAGEDKRVKLWDAQSLSVKSGHNGHTVSYFKPL